MCAGHSAQFCSYTLMENSTQKIICLRTKDKRETERKSTNMERAAFLDAMDEVILKGRDSATSIEEVVTDGHAGIALDMRKLCVLYLVTF